MALIPTHQTGSVTAGLMTRTQPAISHRPRIPRRNSNPHGSTVARLDGCRSTNLHRLGRVKAGQRPMLQHAGLAIVTQAARLLSASVLMANRISQLSNRRDRHHGAKPVADPVRQIEAVRLSRFGNLLQILPSPTQG